MSMTPKSSSSTAQMPFEFGVPIDPGFRKVLQSRIRTLLQAKMEGLWKTGYNALAATLDITHLTRLEQKQNRDKKGIDRHFEISFVPQLLLPLRDNPAKYQNETLLDGEMIVESDSTKVGCAVANTNV
ncbi:hypothetical protein BG003_002597 [Podila horticola]|nr:hypothetical protein BG003_002597 [Podila horticola]